MLSIPPVSTILRFVASLATFPLPKSQSNYFSHSQNILQKISESITCPHSVKNIREAQSSSGSVASNTETSKMDTQGPGAYRMRVPRGSPPAVPSPGFLLQLLPPSPTTSRGARKSLLSGLKAICQHLLRIMCHAFLSTIHFAQRLHLPRCNLKTLLMYLGVMVAVVFVIQNWLLDSRQLKYLRLTYEQGLKPAKELDPLISEICLDFPHHPVSVMNDPTCVNHALLGLQC